MNKSTVFLTLAALLVGVSPSFAAPGGTAHPVTEGSGSTETFTSPPSTYNLTTSGAQFAGLAGFNLPGTGTTLPSMPAFTGFVFAYTSDGSGGVATNELTTVAQTVDGYYHTARGTSTLASGLEWYLATPSSFNPHITSRPDKFAQVFSGGTGSPDGATTCNIQQIGVYYNGATVPASPPYAPAYSNPAYGTTNDGVFNFE